MDYQSFFYPRSVAIIGSMGPGKLGSILAGQILEGGYNGRLYAVNPKAEGINRVTGHSKLTDLPSPPDLAVIVSPASAVASVLADCGKAGTRSAVIITSGFSEAGNSSGEMEISTVAHQYGVRFIGPNCAGIANAGFNFFPTLEIRPPSGGVGLITQSGALGGVVLGGAQQRKLGISKFISYGNGSDLDQVDFLRYLACDDETRVVALYIESVRNGRAFMDALAECAQHKPVVVIKAGRTTAGTRATASHTGSMAGSDAVYDAAIRASGAIRVRTVEEMLDLCEGWMFTPRMQGNRVAIITNSGGPGVLAADLAEELGLNIAEPGPQAQQQLRTFLPGHCSLKNPIDLTVEGTEAGYRHTLQTLLKEYEAAVVINVGTSYLDNLALARGIVDGARASGKPVLANFVPEQLMDESKACLKQNGIASFSSAERAVKILAQTYRYSSFLAKPAPKNKNLSFKETKLLPGDVQMLEPQAMNWLKENNIPVPAFFFARTAEEAIQACEELGYPVVMKVVSPDILHKSDFGGVMVGIRDAMAARQAFETVCRSAQGKDFRGAVIYPMIQDAQEVLIGISKDPQFGPVVAFGLGGIFTEIMRDIVLRVAPVEPDEAMQMINEIRAIKLLQGARGKPACDLEALAQTISTFSRLPFLYPEISEIDLNPVFLLPEGLLVGDVRVIRSPMKEV